MNHCILYERTGKIKLQYLKEQEKGFYVCCPICKTVLIRAQKGLDGVIKCSQCGMFVHVVINGEKIVVDLE